MDLNVFLQRLGAEVMDHYHTQVSLQDALTTAQEDAGAIADLEDRLSTAESTLASHKAATGAVLDAIEGIVERKVTKKVWAHELLDAIAAGRRALQ